MIQGQLDLRQGMKLAEVGNLQRFLNEQGCTDWQGQPLILDEDFGGRTDFALRCWQKRTGLKVTGAFDVPSRESAEKQGFIPFLQALNYTLVHPKQRFIRLIVLHTMEAPEKLDTAENVAAWFANRHAPRYPAPKASAHYNVDCDSIIQCVREHDIAWHAPGANHDGIGVEQAGTAWQSAIQWRDAYSTSVLAKTARLTAKIARRHNIPIRKLSVEEVRGKKEMGFAGHVDVTNAFPEAKGTHQDPGPHFPWDEFLDQVRDHLLQ